MVQAVLLYSYTNDDVCASEVDETESSMVPGIVILVYCLLGARVTNMRLSEPSRV